jgi:hypothetical protein
MTFARDLASFADSASQNLSNRNLIINGAMQVAQRGTSVASITGAGYNTADRWYLDLGTLGTWTQSVENDAPTGSGFRKSLKMLCTTADASPAAGDYNLLVQRFEGQNLQQIAKGTSSAKQLTLSFWVKSNTTGTYILELWDADNTRNISKSYTISASATWEFKTLTFTSDITGVLDNDNARSLDVNFWLGAGSTFSSGTLNTSWNSNTNANRAVGQTNVAAATNNYWQVTGVQLEVGPAPTPFEFKPYSVDLDLCERYYQKISTASARLSSAGGIGGVATVAFYNRQMRSTPTASVTTVSGSGVNGVSATNTNTFYVFNNTSGNMQGDSVSVTLAIEL